MNSNIGEIYSAIELVKNNNDYTGEASSFLISKFKEKTNFKRDKEFLLKMLFNPLDKEEKQFLLLEIISIDRFKCRYEISKYIEELSISFDKKLLEQLLIYFDNDIVKLHDYFHNLRKINSERKDAFQRIFNVILEELLENDTNNKYKEDALECILSDRNYYEGTSHNWLDYISNFVLTHNVEYGKKIITLIVDMRDVGYARKDFICNLYNSIKTRALSYKDIVPDDIHKHIITLGLDFRKLNG